MGFEKITKGIRKNFYWVSNERSKIKMKLELQSENGDFDGFQKLLKELEKIFNDYVEVVKEVVKEIEKQEKEKGE